MMLRIALVITALGAACTNAPASDGKKDAGPSDVDAPPLGDPIDATAGVWTFVDFPDSSCDDGSSTGIGVNIGTSNNLLVFFSGGGACWDFQTCFTLNTAEHGPFKKAQLDQITQGGSPNTVVDRSDAANPFQDWSYVFVPYCTGDIHAGDVVQTYTSGTTSKTLAHVGHKNVLAYLERIGATF
ncbi:MAG TPA: pectin acetylesterase-family hydrolase, partial [Myxococcota bacterium]